MRRTTWATVATAEMQAKFAKDVDGFWAFHCMDIEFDGTKVRTRYDFQVGEQLQPPEWSEWTSWSETWEATAAQPEMGGGR